MKKSLMSVMLVLFCAPTHAATLIHAGQIIDGISAQPLKNVTLVFGRY